MSSFGITCDTPSDLMDYKTWVVPPRDKNGEPALPEFPFGRKDIFRIYAETDATAPVGALTMFSRTGEEIGHLNWNRFLEVKHHMEHAKWLFECHAEFRAIRDMPDDVGGIFTPAQGGKNWLGESMVCTHRNGNGEITDNSYFSNWNLLRRRCWPDGERLDADNLECFAEQLDDFEGRFGGR